MCVCVCVCVYIYILLYFFYFFLFVWFVIKFICISNIFFILSDRDVTMSKDNDPLKNFEDQ